MNCKHLPKLLLAALMFFTIPAFAGQTIIKIAYTETPDTSQSVEAVAAKAFKSYVEEHSDAIVEVYGGAVLGDVDSAIEQTKNGIIQACAVADAKLATIYSPIQIFSIPYLFPDRETAYNVIASEFTQSLVDDMAATTKLRIISLGENGGFRSITNSKREIREPDDLKGLKIRTMSSPLHMDIIRNLGGIPTPMAITELYTALQMNAVDGQENAPIITKVWHFEEVQKYYALDNHVYSITTFVVDENWLSSLPEDLRNTVLEAGKVMEKATRDICREWEGKALDDIRAAGVAVYTPTPEQFEKFRLATQEGAIKWLRDSVDAKWIDGLLAETKK